MRIQAGRVGYAEEPRFEVMAPGQKTMGERIVWEVRYGGGPLRRAIEAEGLWDEWREDRAKL